MSSNTPTNFNNWNRKNQKMTKKMEKNEKLREQYPPYRPSSNINTVHIHHRTNINIIKQLIHQAQTTHRYTIDTESETNYRRPNIGALIQIQMVHSSSYSTVILIETFHLAEATSSLIDEIKKLWNIIFNSGNEIISWGPVRKEFKDFEDVEWIQLGKIISKNLQALFQDQEEGGVTHPATERRAVTTGVSFDTPGDDYFDDDYYNDNYYDDGSTKIKYSLQTAVIMKLNQFIDKSVTINRWGCGLDPVLETWRTKLFQRKYYDRQVEQQTRRDMVNYATHDCTGVTELFFIMYPARKDDIKMQVDHYSDISDDENEEIIQLLSKNTPSSTTAIQKHQQQQPELFLQPEEEESFGTAVELELELEQPAAEPEPPTRSSKAKQQRKKNKKLQEKRRTRPDFQLRIYRPIYHCYDYKKIRAQLIEDRIHTSHYTRITDDGREVAIGFKTVDEMERARKIMRVNYFSREQFYARW